MSVPVNEVEVVDPTHPFYGLRLPLLHIIHRQRLGRVGVVRLYPGVERWVPVAATDLDGILLPRSACRLSVAAIANLIEVVASVAARQSEDADADHALACLALATDQPATRSAARASRRTPPAGRGADVGCAPSLARVGEPEPECQGRGPAHLPPDLSGDRP